MALQIVQVDAFTDEPFHGNPAAVCVLPEPRTDAWMQDVAREMNLSETAFLMRRRGEFDLRWFTPSVEVDLCGHATLASAHVLWEEGHLDREEQARFHTRRGLLTADAQDDWIELNFPAISEQPAAPPAGLWRRWVYRPSTSDATGLIIWCRLSQEKLCVGYVQTLGR